MIAFASYAIGIFVIGLSIVLFLVGKMHRLPIAKIVYASVGAIIVG